MRAPFTRWNWGARVILGPFWELGSSGPRENRLVTSTLSPLSLAAAWDTPGNPALLPAQSCFLPSTQPTDQPRLKVNPMGVALRLPSLSPHPLHLLQFLSLFLFLFLNIFFY